MADPTRIFIHGLESSNQGTKPIFFRERYPDMIIPHFTGDLQKRMDTLKGVLRGKSRIRLVGSSFGGLMATIFTLENESMVERLILLAPAINLLVSGPQERKKTTVPVWLYHGKNDSVIPVDKVAPIAKRAFLNLSFHEVEDDHFLHKTFKIIDWKALLS
jgi:pimeloyl-ACP methyl ester carboxylesterase